MSRRECGKATWAAVIGIRENAGDREIFSAESQTSPCVARKLAFLGGDGVVDMDGLVLSLPVDAFGLAMVRRLLRDGWDSPG